MGKALVITDTTACVPMEWMEQYPIGVIPAANIYFGGESYIENVTITPAEGYDLIKKDPDRFVTSAMSPGSIQDEYHRIVGENQDNYTDILHITISGTLSANNKSAGIAAQAFSEDHPDIKMQVFDSMSVGGGEGLIVLAAARAAASGKSLEEIVKIAESAREQAHAVMIFDTLRYVYRTGRMSKMSARIASLFGIKPISQMLPDGSMAFADRTRKREQGYQKVIELLRSKVGDSPTRFMINHAIAPEYAEEMKGLINENFNVLEMVISDYSMVMGYGGGPGTVLVGCCTEKE